jgi:hypothetical protein
VLTDPSVDFGFYGASDSASQTMPYLVMGDWILAYDYTDYIVTAYKLNHSAKTITDSVQSAKTPEKLKKLIQAQENR